MIRLHLFGTLRLTTNGRSVTVDSLPIAGLLGYLALHASQGCHITRTHLIKKLWPDQPEDQTRRMLTNLLYRLRRMLNTANNGAATALLADPKTLALGNIWVDVDTFRTGVAAPDLAERRAALDLYTGDLLEELDADWLLGQRATLRDLYLTSLAQVCVSLADAGNFVDALAYAQRWVRDDPLSEDAHRAVMRIYARMGRHAAALKQYDQLVQMLDEEFQAPPLTETQALARTIRAEYEGLPDRPLRQKPFVGRRYERALLLQHAEQAQEGRGGFVLVEGEAGLGKTRLIETLAEGAAWRKIGVAWGRARELARQAPYAPLVEALHAALAGPRATMVAERLHPSVVATITGLLPELAGEQGSGKSLSVGGAINAGAELPPMRENDGQRFNLTAALADLLEALSAIVPSVIILDDVQWADPGLWEAMRALVPRIASWRLLVVLSYRATELRTDLAAWQTLCDLDSALAPPRVSLRGLTPDDCADLARRLGAHIEHSTITALHRQTDGNPLFVQELLAAKDDPRATATLHSVLERRLAQLDALARAALEAGAVLGRAFTYPVWRSVVGSDVLAALPAIEAGRFLEENEDGYIFQHDVMREYVYHAIAPERRRTLHRRAATVLSAATAEPSTLAWHYTQAEDWAEAVRAHREAGDAAARIYAYNPALGHYSQALELLASGWQ